jgi:AcrR family transcriptional regulator
VRPAPTAARRDATREAILRGALQRFSAYGFARTSVEDIARTAGVSRAAVYLHFESKEDMFRALAAELHDAHRTAVERAAADEGAASDRIRRVLEAKFGDVAEIASAAHGAELLDETSRLCSDISNAARRHTVGVLRRLIEEGSAGGALDPSRAGLGPQAAAELLFDTARSLEREAPGLSPGAYRRRLGRLSALLVAGLGGGGAPAF